MLDPERLEEMSQGAAAPGCAGLPSGSKRRRFQVAVRLPRSRLRFPRALCLPPPACSSVKRHEAQEVVLLRNGRAVSSDQSIPSRFRPGDENEWRSRFFPMALAPKPATRDRLGKIPAEPVYLGVHAYSDRAHAKTGEGFGENRMGTRLCWRFPPEKRRSRQNRQAAWENSKRNPFILAIAKRSAIRSAKPFGLLSVRKVMRGTWPVLPLSQRGSACFSFLTLSKLRRRV